MPVPRRFDRDAICALLDRGDLTYQQIAAQIGCSTPFVGQVARNTGRGRGKQGGVRKHEPARLYDRAEIKRLLAVEPRLRYREIADRVGCSEGMVTYVARQSGHKRRNQPKPRGPAPTAQDAVLDILRRGPRSERQVSEEHGAEAWRVLDALRRRGLVTCDRTKRPHIWRIVERTTRPGVLEVVSEITAQIVRAVDGRRYLMIPWEHDLRDA